MSEVEVSKFVGFDMKMVQRSQLHFHPDNPRHMDKSAARRLREGLKHHKLVVPVVANWRTEANGFSPRDSNRLVLVGGHQRIAQLDQLHKYDAGTKENDYKIPVSVIQASPAKEVELLLFLNNADTQGNWDYQQMAELIHEHKDDIDIEKGTGFTRVALAEMLDEGILDGLFGEEAAEQVEMEGPIIDQLNEIHEAGLEVDREKRAAEREAEAMRNGGGDGGDDGDDGDIFGTGKPDSGGNGDSSGTAEDSDEDDDLALLKKRRSEWVGTQTTDNDANFSATIVANDSGQLSRLVRAMGLNPAKRYFSAQEIADSLDLNIDED